MADTMAATTEKNTQTGRKCRRRGRKRENAPNPHTTRSEWCAHHHTATNGGGRGHESAKTTKHLDGGLNKTNTSTSTKNGSAKNEILGKW